MLARQTASAFILTCRTTPRPLATSPHWTRRLFVSAASTSGSFTSSARLPSCRHGLPRKLVRSRFDSRGTQLVVGRLRNSGWYSTNNGNAKQEQTSASTGPSSTNTPVQTDDKPTTPELRESPYTIPNALTLARILSCPVLGYCIVQGEFEWATGILFLGGFSDWLDGYIARRFNMRSVFGTILDPAADKTLMTTLVITLAYKGLLPMPLAVLILGRDVALSLSAFWYRYISLPEPKTFKRYWDFSIPSAEVRPTQISKYNTFLQLVLMGTTTVSPILGVDISMPLQALQWTVAGTTLWSGLSYIGSKDAVKILSKKK